jgi:hypothetical protein
MSAVPEILENEPIDHHYHPSSPALEDKLRLLEDGSDVPTDELVEAVQVEEMDIDAILAKGLNQLSMEERYQVLHDLHGVSEVFTEDPEVVQDRLDQLEHCLHKIPDKDAYEHALYLSEPYVRDVKFRKMFLRAHAFQSQAAAECMVKHFHIKRELFGTERLARDLYLTDLNEEDMSALETGFQQRLAIRDRADRTVFCILPMVLGNHSHQARVSFLSFARTVFLSFAVGRSTQRNKKGPILALCLWS